MKNPIRAMRLLILVILLAFGLWSGYWWIGAAAQKTLWEERMSALRAAGWEIDVGALQLRGYPNRFDTQLSNLTVISPRGDWGWSTEIFELFALSYKPHHMIAVAAPLQSITTPLWSARLTSHDLRASLIFTPDTQASLMRSHITARTLDLELADGDSATLARLDMALHRASTPLLYALGIRLENARLPAAWRQAKGAALLPAEVSFLTLDAQIETTVPLDRHMAQSVSAAIMGLTVNSLHAKWGALEIRADGHLEMTAEKDIIGALDLSLSDWLPHAEIIFGEALPPFLKTMSLEPLALTLRFQPDHISIEGGPLGSSSLIITAMQ